jgi:hypothetical protein
MSFSDEQAVAEAVLSEVDSSGDPAFAIMTDGERIEFPKGLKFVPDNSRDNIGRLLQMRIRIIHPVVDGKPKGPSVLLPKGVSRDYVIAVLKRLELGV